MWAAFVSLLFFSAWAGTHSETASSAAATSNTRTVTVNATVNPDIEIYIADVTINLNVTSPGSAVTDTNNIEVWTNSNTGYKLYELHDNNLQHTVDATVIDPNITGTVDAPVPYAHNGLAFSLNGTPVEGLWNNGGNFSTFAAAATECNCYATYAAGNTVINVIYRLDVSTTQKSGTYLNHTNWYAVTNGT